jgi:hypothetical protein
VNLASPSSISESAPAGLLTQLREVLDAEMKRQGDGGLATEKAALESFRANE